MTSYSLTMWDVNHEFWYDSENDEICYSLTMWDVNRIQEAVKMMDLSYSLTMWDVNSILFR